MKEDGEYKGRKKYKPVKFFSNNLEITQYKVVDDKPQVEIKYDGKVVFTNIKGSKPVEKPKEQPNITPHEADGYLESALDNISAIKNVQELDDYLANKAPAQDKYFRSAKINRPDLAEQLNTALEQKGSELI